MLIQLQYQNIRPLSGINHVQLNMLTVISMQNVGDIAGLYLPFLVAIEYVRSIFRSNN